MLLSQLKYFRITCFIPKLFGTILVRWNPTAQRLSLANPFYQKKLKLRIKWYCLITISIISLFNGFHKLVTQPQHHEAWAEAFIFLFDCVSMLWGICNLHVHLCKSDTICLFANGLLEHSHKFGDKRNEKKLKNRSMLELLNLSMAYGATFVACTFLPFAFTFGLHWLDPCKATVAFYRLLPECRGVTMPFRPACISKFFVLLIDYWRWAMCMSSAGFSVGGLLILFPTTLKDHLET